VRHTTDCDSGTLSYNVLLSLSHMYVFPRRCETHTLAMSGSLLSINSHAFAGILLVKSDDELEALIAEGPGNLLKAVTYESMHELQVSGGPEFDGDLGNP
jgi:sulfate adenylyltransferase (ADP) / ATP adenylyltransferase